MIRLLALLLLLTLPFTPPLPAQAAVRGELLDYSSGDTALRGFLAYDDALPGRRPAVLVVHEGWGQNEYARNRARMLAELGYTALAVDMFGEGRVARNPGEAEYLVEAVQSNQALRKARFLSALEALRRHATVDGERIAAIGYSFGGTTVLEMARQGLDLKAVANFHGAFTTERPVKYGAIKGPVLILAGGADPATPEEQIQQVLREMKSAAVTLRIVIYPQAQSGFTNPEADAYARKFGLPLSYDAKADQDSWDELRDLLADAFRPRLAARQPPPDPPGRRSKTRH